MCANDVTRNQGRLNLPEKKVFADPSMGDDYGAVRKKKAPKVKEPRPEEEESEYAASA